MFGDAIDETLNLDEALANTSLSVDFQVAGGLGSQLKQVARLIHAREQRQAERDVFFVTKGGWDTHRGVKPNTDRGWTDVNQALADFVTELRDPGLNVFNDVVIASASDFGRTLDPNPSGTDHGWGGNHFVINGQLNGGQIFNTFPDSFATNDVGRGRQIPTVPWEFMFAPIAEWFGLRFGLTEPDLRVKLFPNIDNFNNASTPILRSRDLFK